MSNETAIAWTDFSSNPIKYRDRETGKTVWACVKKSAGCTNCYSEALALRWSKGRAFSRPNIDQVEPFLDEAEMRRLARDPKLSGKRVFLGDMTDIFGDWIPDEFISHLFYLFAHRTDVTWQLLTKRPERVARVLGPNGIGWYAIEAPVPCPQPNVWIGTSVEDQRAADERIPYLLNTPAAIRFLSCEPLLGPIEFSDVTKRSDAVRQLGHKAMSGIDWVIVGGESGPKHRLMQLEWLTSIIDQCEAVDVAQFVKQDSGLYPGRQGRIPDAYWWPRKNFPRSRAAAEPPAGRGAGGDDV
jgi:protein gp37